jgi:hypothetical protein
MAAPLHHSVPGTEDDAEAGILPFIVELWEEDRTRVQAVLARVHSATLGQAVFRASQAEYPGRYLTLRRGDKIISQTAEA